MPGPSELFDSTAAYYARYRSAYPDELFDLLGALVPLSPQMTAVDVGCGTGQIAVPLADRVERVIAVDPEPGMLAHGRAAAERAGVAAVEWRHGDSSQFADLGIAGAGLAVFAASFHWTDRPARTYFLGSRRRAGSGFFTESERSHADVLRDSPFSDIHTASVRWERTLTVDDVVGLQFTYSFSTPAMLGHRADLFADAVREAVLAVHPEGVVTEPFRADVLIARRDS